MEGMGIDTTFYKGKRVFITGHTGFKGSWLTSWLIKSGAVLKGYALAPNTQPALFNILDIGNNIESVYSDISQINKLSKEVDSFKPEIIFHLAAQPLVRESYSDPHYTYNTNVLGTVNILEAARNCSSVRAIVAITTDKVYKNKERDSGYSESDEIGGYDPYSASKACCEIIIDSYRQSFLSKSSVLIVSARAGNVIGGGDWSKDRIIPDAVRSFSSGKKLQVRNPKSVRPWQHVLEPLSGYLMLGKYLLEGKSEFEGPWNFGPLEDDRMNVGELAELIARLWSKDATFEILKLDGQLHETKLLSLDINKARTKLNWQPSYNSGKALEKTIKWYSEYYKGTDMNELTRSQIEDFEKLSCQVEYSGT
ncbi:CDP-glucose 4,6-dehydratase [soil metagenome]